MIWHRVVLSRTPEAAYVAASEHEYGGRNDGFKTFDTVNETCVPVVKLPLVNVTVRIPLTRVAVAAGPLLMPEKEETIMLWLGTLVKLLSVTTKRFKLLTLVGVKDIQALVDEPAAEFSRLIEMDLKES